MELKDKIINEIITKLTPLRFTHEEIDLITNDLLMEKLESLENFLTKNYQDVNISPELKDLVVSLTESGKLANNYLELINPSVNSKEPNYNNSLLRDFKPLNIRPNNFSNIKQNIDKGKIIPNIEILETFKISKNEPNDSYEDDEILSLEDTHIEKLRKLILNAQLNYLNNASSFILELESKDEADIYQNLLSLNDIRYIHHSISKLSKNTLKRLLVYVEELLKENSHNSINIFIEEAIKKNLHEKD